MPKSKRVTLSIKFKGVYRVLDVYRTIVRPLLFHIDPETAHGIVIKLLEIVQSSSLLPFVKNFFDVYEDQSLEIELFGLKFKNPLGLAAGFDKKGSLVKIMPNLGFGFVEVGTVTAQAQPGNPRPRIFRMPEDFALINRMGFNSEGASAVSDRLKKLNKTISPKGINIGKTEVVEIEDAVEDYLYSFKKLYCYGDYFVVNVSCPNTSDLQKLQDRGPLQELAQALNEENNKRAAEQGIHRKPLLVKISPDLSLSQIDDVIEVIVNEQLDGIVAVNTTTSRDGLRNRTSSKEWGGVSGRPLAKTLTKIIRHIYRRTKGKLPIIGVGGIFTAEDAYEKIKAGASLIQLYTGMIYTGPTIAASINKGLIKLMEKDGYKRISEVIGTSVN